MIKSDTLCDYKAYLFGVVFNTRPDWNTGLSKILHALLNYRAYDRYREATSNR